MKTHSSTLLSIRLRLLALLIVIISWSWSEEPAYGHTDFRPSPARPIGWMGDGTARYPGATPPTQWDEASGKGIRWMTRLPMPSNAQPIVVGDKVLALADPDVVVCCDAATGAILWQRQCFLDIFPHLKGQPADELQTIRDAFCQAIDANYWLYMGGLQARWGEQWREAATRLPNNEALQELVARLNAGTHPVVKQAFSKGETNTRVFTTDAVLEAAGLPKGYEQEDWDWYTCTFVPPISDGQRIYVRLLFDTVVALDLDGKHQWTWSGPDKRRGLGISTNIMMLAEGRLYVPHGDITVLDAATGKAVAKIDQKKDLQARTMGAGQVLTPFEHDGVRYLIASPGRSAASVIRARDAEVVCQLPGGPPPNGFGAVVVDGVLYAGYSNYGSKKDTGLSAYRLTSDGGSFDLEKVWRYTSHEYQLADSLANGHLNIRQGKESVKLTWRGLCVAENRVYGCQDGHGVVQCDRRTGLVLDICVAVKETTAHTVEPLVAGRHVVYVHNWSGVTAIFDDRTGKLVATNRVEPGRGAAPTVHGNSIYIRGFHHLYGIGAKP